LSRFERIRLKSLQKSANMTPKICFPNIFIIGIKNPEFDADFESVEKVAKKFTRRKLEG
jgi:hypothetical protein